MRASHNSPRHSSSEKTQFGGPESESGSLTVGTGRTPTNQRNGKPWRMSWAAISERLHQESGRQRPKVSIFALSCGTKLQIFRSDLTPAALCQFRDDRLTKVSASTVRKELNIIQHALKVAQREWGLVVPQEAIKGVTKPAPNCARERRLSEEELDALLGALDQCRNKLVKPVFLFALATGMRRSEVLSLTWSNVDVKSCTAFLPMTKNGSCRTVPLSVAALALLEAQTLQRDLSHGRCFPLSANALRLAWERVKRRANIKDLRFHDLRHEAISRFFEMGLSVPEVSLISGHKDARMLFRYTHLKAEKVAQKLQSLDAAFDAHLPTDNTP